MWVRQYISPLFKVCLLLCLGLTLFVAKPTSAAINQLPTPAPGSSSYGLEATKPQPAPTRGATITVPGNGASFSTSPITVSGICQTGLLVQVYNNQALVGAVMCLNGSFSLQVMLFPGQNDLTASVYDDLDQAGPPSNTVSVTLNDTNFSAFSSLITLTSNYGRRAANPGTTLTWPLLLSGGAGPYAFSIDWGDGKQPTLKSQGSPGVVNIDHVYEKAGVYTVTVRVTDANGVTAYLQLVAVVNGAVTATSTEKSDSGGATTVTKVLWIPAVICLILLFPTYWLGRRSQLVSIRHRLAKDMATYKEI